MSDRKLQLNKKPVRALDTARMENVTGGLADSVLEEVKYKKHPKDDDQVEELLTKTRCIGINGSS